MASAFTAPIRASRQRGRTCLFRIDSYPALVFGSSSSQVDAPRVHDVDEAALGVLGVDVRAALHGDPLLVEPSLGFLALVEDPLDLRGAAPGRIGVAGAPLDRSPRLRLVMWPAISPPPRRLWHGAPCASPSWRPRCAPPRRPARPRISRRWRAPAWRLRRIAAAPRPDASGLRPRRGRRRPR